MNERINRITNAANYHAEFCNRSGEGAVCNYFEKIKLLYYIVVSYRMVLRRWIGFSNFDS